LAAHVEKWPWRPKIRHSFDMAGEKFVMPSGPGTLVARTLLLVNLQPAQTGSPMSNSCQKRRAEARRWHSARQNVRNGRSKFDMVLAMFDMSSTSKFPATKNLDAMSAATHNS
jgi:selenocysteine lyase/cysteine desulfurase